VAFRFGERQQKRGPSLGYRVDFTAGAELKDVKMPPDSGKSA
jgi:hypothetical protein